MKTTEYGDVILNTKDIVSGLYSGNINNLDGIFLEDLEEYKKFADACKKNFENLGKISTFTNYDTSKEEFDKTNQNNWFMPKEYLNFDIVKWLCDRCQNSEQLDRVTKELELFDQHNMITLLNYLKYLVDTMRQHNLVWGVGRGSSVASYCLYLIGVHKVDSIKYELDINEFLK